VASPRGNCSETKVDRPFHNGTRTSNVMEPGPPNAVLVPCEPGTSLESIASSRAPACRYHAT
jgi:hypothetical protein